MQILCKLLCLVLTCFPNGLLESQYCGKVLCVGKIASDVRANLNSLLKFQLLPNAYRTMVLYVNDKIIANYDNKLGQINI